MYHHDIGNEDNSNVKHIHNIQEAALLINQLLAMLRDQACNTAFSDPEQSHRLIHDTLAVVTALIPYGEKLYDAASHLGAEK